MYLYIFLCI